VPDINQWSSELRGIPDQALENELQNPRGVVPSYLVLAEAQRRQLMRQASEQQQQQGQQSSTVLQDVVRNMMAQQPAPGVAPAGMAPKASAPPSTPGQMPTPTPPQPPKAPGMAGGGPIRFADGGATPEDIDGWINKYSDQYGVDSDDARAIMQQESSGNPFAAGPITRQGQAYGLFQLMPGTAHDMGVDRRVPEQNVHGGIKYYSNMLRRYGGNRELALAAYNAGPHWVDQYNAIPPFGETQKYVPQVIARADKFRKARQQAADQPAGPPQMNPAMRGPNYQPPPVASGWQPAITPPTHQSLESLAAQAPPAPDIMDAPGGTPPQQSGAPAPPAPDQGEIPSAPSSDPWSTASIDRTRQLWDTLTGDSAESRQRLEQTRAATIQQLQQLRDEQLERYHNPSPWEFLSNLAAGMSGSKNLTMAGAFSEGVGHAWKEREAQQQQSISNIEALQKNIEAVQNVGQTERERMGAQMVNLLTRAPQGAAEFQKFLSLPGVSYGQKGKPPGADYAFKEDPTQPGWGVWVPTGQALQPVKGSETEQVFRGATKAVNTMLGLPANTAYENQPVSMTLKQPLTLPQDMPQPDGSVMKAGTVLPVGATVYPMQMTELLRDRSKSQQAEQTAVRKALAGPEGRRQQVEGGMFMQDGYTDEQKKSYIDTGKGPQKVDDLAAAVANGSINIKEAMSRGQLSDRNFLIKKIKEINPNYREDVQEAQYAGIKKTEGNFSSGTQGTRVQGIGTLIGHMDNLYRAVDGLNNGDLTALNSIANAVGAQTGNVPLSVYKSIVTAVGPELAKAYIATGGTEEDRAKIEKLFNENTPPEALKAAIAARAKLLAGPMETLNQQYVNGTYGRGTLHMGFWKPETIGALERLAPGAVRNMTRAQVQRYANDHFGGDFSAAQKRLADEGIFLSQ